LVNSLLGKYALAAGIRGKLDRRDRMDRMRPGRDRGAASLLALLACFGVVFGGARAVEAAPTSYQAAVNAGAPILYYQLNEATGVAVNRGSLGHAFDATYFGTPQRAVATARGDAGVAFDGEDDYLESAAVAPESLSGNPTFTAEAVFFVPAGGTATLWAPLLHWGESVDVKTMQSVSFGFSSDDPTKIFAGFYDGGLQTVAPVALGRWHHVVWVRQGGGAADVGSTVYVDGLAVDLEDDPDLPADDGTPAVVNTAFRVNRAQDLTRYFSGTVDELALYDRALDPSEVLAHYVALVSGVCTTPPEDLVAWWPGDGNAHDLVAGNGGKLRGGATFAIGRVGVGFSLDGINDDVAVANDPALDPTGPFSVDAWIQADPTQMDENGEFQILDKSQGFTDGTGWALLGNADGTVSFLFGLGGGDPSNLVAVTTTSGVLDGSWHHVAGVFDGTALEVYLDGVMEDGTAFEGTPANNARGFSIGSSWGGGTPVRYFRGIVDEVDVFDRALAPEEVLAIYAAGGAGKCKPALCQAGTCRDADGSCRSCAQPLSSGATPTASDALAILRTATGSFMCRPCVCDTDSSGAVVATDALLVLKRATGQPITLACPAE
jgi:hypothetical protein